MKDITNIMSRRIRYTIDDCHRIAKERGGKCLSKKFQDSKTPVTWECADGHTWGAVMGKIINGSWCGECKSPTIDINDCKDLANKK